MVKIHHQALIVLYGLGNKGKTSTLTDLLFLLTNASIRNYVNKNLITSKSLYSDAYYVLNYQGKSVFIATYGDGRLECERNIYFFEHRPIDKPIYIIDGNNIWTLDQLSKTEQKKNYYDVVPAFCISACRTEGGSVDAMMYLADKMLPHLLQVVWIRKMGMKNGDTPEYINPKVPIITHEDDNVAKDIKKFIDRVRNKEHCI